MIRSPTLDAPAMKTSVPVFIWRGSWMKPKSAWGEAKGTIGIVWLMTLLDLTPRGMQ